MPSQQKMDRFLEEQVRGLPSRTNLPAFVDLRGDAAGNTWVAEYPSPETLELQWVIFDSTFQPIARVVVPRGLEILDIAADAVAILEADGPGRESIHVYDIIR